MRAMSVPHRILPRTPGLARKSSRPAKGDRSDRLARAAPAPRITRAAAVLTALALAIPVYLVLTLGSLLF